MTLTLGEIVVFSAMLFATGVYAVLTTRNAVRMLMGIELIFNAANVNFVAYASTTGLAEGLALAIISISIAAAEAAIGIAIVLLLDKLYKTIDVDRIRELKG